MSAFLQRQLPDHRHPEKDHYTLWKLCHNPTHPGFVSAMVVDPGEQIVSTCTITPKRIWWHQQEELCGELGDSFTDAAYLRRGMFAACVDGSRSRAQAAGLGIIYGLPNELALPGYLKKLNFSLKEPFPIDTHYALLGTRSLASRTRVAQIPGLRALLGHPLVTSGSRELVGLLYRAAARPVAGLVVTPGFPADDEIDDLWQRARPSLPIAIVRDSRALRWRFDQNPFPFVMLSVRRNGLLVGYAAVLTLHHDQQDGFTHTLLLDWLYDPAEAPGVRQALLSGVIRHALESGADVLSAVSARFSPHPLPFARLGFIPRPRYMPIIVHRNEVGKAFLADASPWHFTMGDTDAF